MSKKLVGKVAVVTGASKGIGASIARALAEEGASVVVNYSSSKQDAERVVAEIAARGGTAIAVQADVSKPAHIEGLFSEARRSFGRLDILVNNAGVYEFSPLEGVTEEHFHRHFNVNVLGLLFTTKEAVKQMGPEGGSIINIGSISGLRGNLGRAAYGASKGGLVTMSEVMAVELASRKIRVNLIAPGPIETPLIETVMSPAERAIWTKHLPLGRYGTAAEVAATALFLASEDASYITGHVLAVDGGFLAGGVIESPPRN